MFVKNYIKNCSTCLCRIMVVYDLTYAEVYNVVKSTSPYFRFTMAQEVSQPKGLINLDDRQSPFLLIVMLNNLYDTLGDNSKAELDKYRINIALNNSEFLAEIIKIYSVYNNLSLTILKIVIKEILKFYSGY